MGPHAHGGKSTAEEDVKLALSFSAPVDRTLKDGHSLDVGSLKVHVLHTPGHTPGSVCFLVEGNLFTGDTLFVGTKKGLLS